jgi:hypothetical protein
MLTSGQDYAVKFLAAKGFKFISTPRQIERGNLIFTAPDGDNWAIFRNSGYVRKAAPGADRWQVVHRELKAQHEGGGAITDDQYMDLAEMISQKYSRAEASLKHSQTPAEIAKKEERDSKRRIKELFDFICVQIEHPQSRGVFPVAPKDHDEIIKVIDKLVDKYYY